MIPSRSGQFALARPFANLTSGPMVAYAPVEPGSEAPPADDAPAAPAEAPAADPPAEPPAQTHDAPKPEDKPADAPAEELNGEGGDDLLGTDPDELKLEGDKPPVDPEAVAADIDFEKITPPEGFESLDTEALKAAAPVLAELGIDLKDTAKVQKVVDLYGKAGAKLVETAFSSAIEAHNAKVAGWKAEIRGDKDFAPNEATFKSNMAASARGLAKFFDPALVEELKASGLANNPHLVRGMAAVGKALAEDTTPPPKQTADPVDPAHKMYPGFAPAERVRA